MTVIPVDHRTLERCLQFAGLTGLTVSGPWTHGEIPGVGYIRCLERAPWDRRGLRVYCVGLTDEAFFVKKNDPSRCVRGEGSHRSVWRFAQLVAQRVLKVQSKLAQVTSPVRLSGR